MKTRRVSESSVLILSNERDFAADEVVAQLMSKGARVWRLNIESARSVPLPPWEVDDPETRPVVWWRQFEFDERPDDLAAVDDLLVERAQWRSWISCLATPGSRWMNSIWSARRAESKIEQLRVARAVGFQVPRTLVTNCRADAEVFASGNPRGTIVKTLASAFHSFSDQSFVFTESFDHPALANAEGWHQAPLLVQARVEGDDARVVVFGAHAFGARCTAGRLDWRTLPDQSGLWRPWNVPEMVRDSCARYLAEMGLEYAAFDFMLDDDVPYFLEANQAGEFAFLDRALDLGVASAIADRLIELGST